MKKRLEDNEYMERQREHLEKIRPMTKERHSSEEGRLWHSEHVKSSLSVVRTKEWREANMKRKTCKEC
tara:strand:+ start:568 stop:771 length:204 start_codon:yes stop_codon:yes gene_type:complete